MATDPASPPLLLHPDAVRPADRGARWGRGANGRPLPNPNGTPATTLRQQRWRAGKKAKAPPTPRAAAAAPAGKPDAAPLDLAQPRSVKRPLGLLVTSVNDLALAIPWTRADALSQQEAEQLVDTLDRAQQADPRIRKRLLSATEGAGVIPLIVCLLGIMLVRLMRHNVIPAPRLTPEEAEELQRRVVAMQAAAQPEPPPAAGMAPDQVYMGANGALRPA
jgi:hypothetical protein